MEDDLPGARSARLVAWGTAFLTGAMGLADAAAAIAAGDEAVAHDGGGTPAAPVGVPGWCRPHRPSAPRATR